MQEGGRDLAASTFVNPPRLLTGGIFLPLGAIRVIDVPQ